MPEEENTEVPQGIGTHHLIVLGKPGHPTAITEYYSEEDVMQAFIQECQSHGVEPGELELSRGRFEMIDGTIVAVSFNTITNENGPAAEPPDVGLQVQQPWLPGLW